MEGHPFTVFIDADALDEVLALAHPDSEVSVDDEVVDLCDASIDLEPEIMDDRSIPILGVIEIDLVGGVALTLRAGPDRS